MNNFQFIHGFALVKTFCFWVCRVITQSLVGIDGNEEHGKEQDIWEFDPAQGQKKDTACVFHSIQIGTSFVLYIWCSKPWQLKPLFPGFPFQVITYKPLPSQTNSFHSENMLSGIFYTKTLKAISKVKDCFSKCQQVLSQYLEAQRYKRSYSLNRAGW